MGPVISHSRALRHEWVGQQQRETKESISCKPLESWQIGSVSIFPSISTYVILLSYFHAVLGDISTTSSLAHAFAVNHFGYRKSKTDQDGLLYDECTTVTRTMIF